MGVLENKSIILLFTLLFAVVLCGAVSAASNMSTGKTISAVSTHSPVSTASPKLIDSGVTKTKGYYVLEDQWGNYKSGKIVNGDSMHPGMKYPTNYYWKTYLYSNGNIVIYTHFYHTSLKRTMYQKLTMGTKMVMNNHGLYKRMVYLTVTPKNWGGSNYLTNTGFLGTPLNYYWHPQKGYHSFKYYMIRKAPIS